MAPLGASTWEARKDRIRVLVADDHPAVARGIERLIVDQPDLRLVGTAPDAQSALWLPDCDVAVLDYHLGQRSGLWLTLRLKRRPDPPAVVLYSAFSDDVLALAAAVAGADGVLRKSAATDELCVAIRRVAIGERYMPRVPSVVVRAMSSLIAPEHRAVFALLAGGWGPDHIADHLGLGLDQVEQGRDAAVAALSPAVTRARLPLGPVRSLRATTFAR